MRVLIVTNLYPPHAFGGYEDLCAGAVRAWRSSGHEVSVLTSRWYRDDIARKARAPDGERVHRLLPLYWDDHRILDPSLATCLRWERTTRNLVDDVVAQATPDVVSVWNAGGLSSGLFTYLSANELPLVLVVGDRWLTWIDRADPWARRFTGRFGRVAARAVGPMTGLSTGIDVGASRVVACFASDFLRSDADERARLAVDDAAVVPHGVDLHRYPLVDLPDSMPPWNGRLLYVGRIAPEKGLDTAVRSLVHLPGTTLDIIGGGDPAHTRELERLAAVCGVDQRVLLHGEAGPSDLRGAYLAADALVFPSTWQEPFGIAPLEAMACGLPVVATATGGSGEFLVEDHTALRFEPNDPGGLAARIHKLADDAALRQRLRNNGRAAAAWLSRGRTYEELAAWHRFAIDERTARPEQRALLPPSLRTAGVRSPPPGRNGGAGSAVDDQV